MGLANKDQGAVPIDKVIPEKRIVAAPFLFRENDQTVETPRKKWMKAKSLIHD